MANKVDALANRAHGQDPTALITTIIRERIYASRFWKEHCFALDIKGTVCRIIETVDYIGGMYGAALTKPSPFICLLLKLLQLGPDQDIIEEMILQSDFKYLRALAAMYLRLVGRGEDVYEVLEMLMVDFRKLVYRPTATASLEIVHMDEFIDKLLHEDDSLGICFVRLPKRKLLQSTYQLGPYESPMRHIVEDMQNQFANTRAAGSDGDQNQDHNVKKRQRTKVNDDAEGKQGEYSDEHWNRIRAELGLKPLK